MTWWQRRAPETPTTPLERLQERASAYLDGELTAAERAAFEVDLASSEVAREQLADLRFVRDALAGIGSVHAPRSFTLIAPPAPVRNGPRPLEWATRAGTGIAALLFVVVLTNGGSAGDTPIALQASPEVALSSQAQEMPVGLSPRPSGGAADESAPAPAPTMAAIASLNAATSADNGVVTAAAAPQPAIPIPAVDASAPSTERSPAETIAPPTRTAPAAAPVPAREDTAASAASAPSAAPVMPGAPPAEPITRALPSSVAKTAAADPPASAPKSAPAPTAAPAPAQPFVEATTARSELAPVTDAPSTPPAATAAASGDGTMADSATSDLRNIAAIALGAVTLLLGAASAAQSALRRIRRN